MEITGPLVVRGTHVASRSNWKWELGPEHYVVSWLRTYFFREHVLTHDDEARVLGEIVADVCGDAPWYISRVEVMGPDNVVAHLLLGDNLTHMARALGTGGGS